MNNRIIDLILIVIVWLTGCTSAPHYPHSLQQAVLLMDSRPDSALALLQGMDDSVTTLSEEARMYHQLLTLQAEDKQYIPHTHDSLINTIVTFYEDYGDRAKLMLAYYYQGRVFRDMNDAPRALKAFQQAVEVNHPDYRLLAKTYNQMGNLFAYQNLYDEAIQVNRQSIKMYEMLGEENKVSYALRDIARMYDAKEQNDSSLTFYKKALQVALSDNDSIRYYGILGELGNCYYSWGMADTAQLLMTKALSKSKISNKGHLYLHLGYIYEKKQMWDSAVYYYNQTVSEGGLYPQASAWERLYHIENAKGKQAKAISFLERAMTIKDSIYTLTQTEATAKINALYNYQHIENENAALLKDLATQRFSTLLVTSLIIISGVLIYVRQQNKNHKNLLHEQQLKHLEEVRHCNSLAALKENTIKLAELDKLLSESQKQNDFLQERLLEAEKKKLTMHNQTILATEEEKELRISQLQHSEIYLLMHRNSTRSKDITPERWKVLQQAIDETYPHFTQKLQTLYPQISELECRVCWLTKLNVSSTQIAELTNRSCSAISNIRSRLYGKMFRTEGTSKDMSKFIADL